MTKLQKAIQIVYEWTKSEDWKYVNQFTLLGVLKAMKAITKEEEDFLFKLFSGEYCKEERK